MGEALGLPETLVWRQPFPGPGLTVRCLGEVTRERVSRLRAADDDPARGIIQRGFLTGFFGGNTGREVNRLFRRRSWCCSRCARWG